VISEIVELLKVGKKEERYFWKSLLVCRKGEEKR